MKNLESIYDKEIAPALLEVAKKCRTHGLSCFFVVGYGKDDAGLTSYIGDVAPDIIATLEKVYAELFPGIKTVTFFEKGKG